MSADTEPLAHPASHLHTASHLQASGNVLQSEGKIYYAYDKSIKYHPARE